MGERDVGRQKTDRGKEVEVTGKNKKRDKDFHLFYTCPPTATYKVKSSERR